MIHVGDCLEVLRTIPDCSVDSIVTDPPYGLGKEPDALAMLADWLATGHHDVKGTGFMGKDWDAFVPQPALWRECLRVLKPGGHLLAFAGTRTHDLMTLGLRIAGFEIRDTIMWVYSTGFPKSLDVSKAIDKAAGVEREVLSERENRSSFDPDAQGGGGFQRGTIQVTAPATDAARQWEGWGTALKPALEPITVARKPLDGTVAANVLAHGTGALNIDGCRVEASQADIDAARVPRPNTKLHRPIPVAEQGLPASYRGEGLHDMSRGRWPANLIHDGSDEVVALFPSKAGASAPASGPTLEGAYKSGSMAGHFNGMGERAPSFHADSGSAARFFYCAKASREDRNAGCEGMPLGMPTAPNGAENAVGATRGSRSKPRENTHPTVKPTDLMRYLCRLVTPPGGTVLDPFAGSGSTGKAARLEGFEFIGIELSPEYAAIAEARIRATHPGLPLGGA